MAYDWNFSVLADPAVQGALARGMVINIQLSVIAIVLGTPLGFVAGVLSCLGGRTDPGIDEIRDSSSAGSRIRRSVAFLWRWSLLAAVDAVRAIPLLLFVMLAYYGLPVLVNTGPVRALAAIVGHEGPMRVSPLASCAAALTINLAAFVADVIRGATAGVPRGSVLAARSLGMSRWLIWRRVILPESVRDAVPAIALLWITIFKMSTLVSAVAVADVLHQATSVMNQTFRPLELYLAVGVLFVVLLLPLSAAARRLERTSLLKRRSL